MNDIDTFSGEENFAASPERIYAALTDLDVDGPLVKSIPDLVSAERADERTLRCKVKPGFSFIRATLKMTVELIEADAAQRLAMLRITSTGIGTSMKVECHMKVEDAASTDTESPASRIAWKAHVLERKGLIAAVSPALIRGAADTVIRNGWDAMRRNIEA